MNAAPCAFLPGNILIPKNVPLEKWAVIACDQFTSQPEYWKSARALAAGQPSTLDMILPEAELDTGNRQERIARIHASMEAALDGMQEYPASYVYVERTLQNGRIRRGVVGVLDLEAYSFQEDSSAPVRATERTVVERIPPRMEIRRGAALDLSHALLLCDDDRGVLLESLTQKRALLPKLYDFDLMLGGGHITGYLVSGEAARDFSLQVQDYEQRRREAGSGLLYAVGDGNHSLATAKSCYAQAKKEDPDSPLRYALVELQDIRDEAQRFEPIHRIVKAAQVPGLLAALERECCAPEGYPIACISGKEQATLRLNCLGGKLPVSVLQDFLDRYLQKNPGTLDYIHGEEALLSLAAQPGNVGFLLPPLEKEGLFGGVCAAGVLPRKTFSMGHAKEKRYYLESRRLRKP